MSALEAKIEDLKKQLEHVKEKLKDEISVLVIKGEILRLIPFFNLESKELSSSPATIVEHPFWNKCLLTLGWLVLTSYQ